jgi:hypothetical protein
VDSTGRRNTSIMEVSGGAAAGVDDHDHGTAGDAVAGPPADPS